MRVATKRGLAIFGAAAAYFSFLWFCGVNYAAIERGPETGGVFLIGVVLVAAAASFPYEDTRR